MAKKIYSTQAGLHQNYTKYEQIIQEHRQNNCRTKQARQIDATLPPIKNQAQNIQHAIRLAQKQSTQDQKIKRADNRMLEGTSQAKSDASHINKAMRTT